MTKKISSVISLSFLVLIFIMAANAHGGKWILLGENTGAAFSMIRHQSQKPMME